MSSLADQVRFGGEIPRHIAIIMDGNGRWARARGLPRSRGHEKGMTAVREGVEGCLEVGVEILTLYAFSTENWQRPPTEISSLMTLLRTYAEAERMELSEQGVEVHVLGEVDRISLPARTAVRRLASDTKGGDRLRLNLMISYGSREEILRGVRRLAEQVKAGRLEPDDIDEDAFAGELFTRDLPDPDLLIRTSGEYRLSNFLLWQLAYTELYSTPVLWPDFTRDDLFRAVLDYQKRDRRFGRVST